VLTKTKEKSSIIKEEKRTGTKAKKTSATTEDTYQGENPKN